MMNSVGAEKDPYLQAYIQARMKNHVEEIKLQKVLANLEVGRRIKKIMLNMELFEDRKMAHKLKQEVSDSDSQRKSMRKYLNSNKMEHFDKMHPNARIIAFTSTQNALNNSNNKKNNDDDNNNNNHNNNNVTYSAEDFDNDALLSSSQRRTSVYPVTKGNTTNEPLESQSRNIPFYSHYKTPRHSIVTENLTVGNHISITVPSSPSNHPHRQRDNLRRRSTIMRENTLSSDILMSSHSTVNNSATNHGRRRSSLIPQITTPIVIRVEDTSATDRLKTAATVPIRGQARKGMDSRSVKTLPTLLPSQESGSPSRTNRPKTSNFWAGDPNAIRSVRRERRKPEEMLSLVKNGEEARRLIRDMPPTCSKNCSKPDILQELGRSYSDLPNLLPAIEKARHAFARREAANRDMPGDNEEEENAEPTAMPVSEIQYSALRSMGGVRRNSVIA